MHIHTRLTTAALMGFVLIAASACGGGGGLTKMEEDALQEQVEAAEEAKREAEAKAAEEERKRKEAESKAAEEERKRQAAEEAEQEAEEQRQAAEEAEQEAEEQRQAAEAERLRLEQEAEEARQRANADEAKRALNGLTDTSTRLSAPTAVSVGYRTAARVTVSGLTPRSTSTSSSGLWFITRLSDSDDELTVYSDVGPPERIKMFGRSEYARAFDTDGTLSGDGIDPSGTGLVSTSSSFKRNDTVTFPRRNHDNDDGTTPLTTGRIAGTLDGASGYFECTGDSDCSVANTGGTSFTFTGTWSFHPGSKDATTLEDDDSYMYLGSWVREAAVGESPFAYNVFHGGQFRASDVSAAEGVATYSGPAIGHYAVHQPAALGGSASGEHGRFTATARLTANFDTDMLGGTITNFSHAPNWSLILENTAISSGAVADGDVEWSIGGTVGTGVAADTWTAQFYRDSTTGTAQPEGVAGTFDATYGSNAHILGAFGAHK